MSAARFLRAHLQRMLRYRISNSTTRPLPYFYHENPSPLPNLRPPTRHHRSRRHRMGVTPNCGGVILTFSDAMCSAGTRCVPFGAA